MKFFNKLVIALPVAGAMLLAGCGGGSEAPPVPPIPPQPEAPVATTGLAFSTVEAAPRSAIRSPRTIVVKTPAEMNQLWSEHTQGMASPPAAPAVDFSQKMVVGVFLGDVGCKSAEIYSVQSVTDKIAVRFANRPVQTVDVATCAPSDGSPMILAAVARKDAQVQFADGGVAPSDARTMDGIDFSTAGASAWSNIHTPRTVVIKDQASFAQLWAEHTSTEAMPVINFGEKMVLAVFRGGGSACTTFGIKRVGMSAGKIVVEHEDLPIPDVVCIAVVTYPMHMVAIARSDAPVEFEKTNSP